MTDGQYLEAEVQAPLRQLRLDWHPHTMDPQVPAMRSLGSAADRPGIPEPGQSLREPEITVDTADDFR